MLVYTFVYVCVAGVSLSEACVLCIVYCVF